MSKIKVFDVIALGLFLLFSAYFYIGFFHPHPTVFEGSKTVEYLILSIKLLLPAFITGIIIIYIGVRIKKIKKSLIALVIITLIFCYIITYPIGNYFYQQRYKIQSSDYNTYLQRNPDLPKDVKVSNYNIFCMGGSTTEFKDKNGRDWPGLVEKELKEKYNFQNVKVYNIGKAWYTTLHMLINYEENLRKFKPDLLIVMENINDAWHNADFSRFSNGSFREDYGHYLGPEAFMLKSSSIFSYLSHFFNLLWYSDNIEIINTNNFPGIVPFGRNLKTIIALAKMDSTQVVLMTQPNLYKDKEEPTEYKALGMLLKEAVSSTKRWSYFTALSALRQYNNKIKEVADKEHVHLIDLEKEVPKSLEYFYDDVHYQEKTYDLIADYISQQIAPIIVETKKN